MTRALLDYYRCPEDIARVVPEGRFSEEPGFFRFGSEATCYGRLSGARPARRVDDILADARMRAGVKRRGVALPFDPSDVVDNLRLERYRANTNGWTAKATRTLQSAYYGLRPISPTFVRTSVQRIYYSGWQEIPFPLWPVDFSVDRILQGVLTMLLETRPAEGVPFIWFWPHGFSSCAMMTHDVESARGRDFCPRLMDLNDAFGIRASFQIVPEGRYQVSDEFLDSIRSRGQEINVHDLNHDGLLFGDRETFCARAEKINRYARAYGAHGFRAGAMYRQAAWYDALDVSYDMSIPNVAHLEPQRGGCCTVMPYFIGDILELPLTATQDWALINVLREHSCDLWKREIDMITAEHGLVSFIVHPDYLIRSKAQQVYAELLAHLAMLRSEGKLWVALPREINEWWRQRAKMRIVRRHGGWTIEGPGKEHARIAYARLVDGRLNYVLESAFTAKASFSAVKADNAALPCVGVTQRLAERTTRTSRRF